MARFKISTWVCLVVLTALPSCGEHHRSSRETTLNFGPSIPFLLYGTLRNVCQRTGFQYIEECQQALGICVGLSTNQYDRCYAVGKACFHGDLPSCSRYCSNYGSIGGAQFCRKLSLVDQTTNSNNINLPQSQPVQSSPVLEPIPVAVPAPVPSVPSPPPAQQNPLVSPNKIVVPDGATKQSDQTDFRPEMMKERPSATKVDSPKADNNKRHDIIID